MVHFCKRGTSGEPCCFFKDAIKDSPCTDLSWAGGMKGGRWRERRLLVWMGRSGEKPEEEESMALRALLWGSRFERFLDGMGLCGIKWLP